LLKNIPVPYFGHLATDSSCLNKSTGVGPTHLRVFLMIHERMDDGERSLKRLGSAMIGYFGYREIRIVSFYAVKRQADYPDQGQGRYYTSLPLATHNTHRLERALTYTFGLS
jgi:hypothetical protein